MLSLWTAPIINSLTITCTFLRLVKKSIWNMKMSAHLFQFHISIDWCLICLAFKCVNPILLIPYPALVPRSKISALCLSNIICTTAERFKISIYCFLYTMNQLLIKMITDLFDVCIYVYVWLAFF